MRSIPRMRHEEMVYQSVGICLKPDQEQHGSTARGLEKWLAGRGLRVVLDEFAAEVVGRPGISRSELAEQVDFIVVLGGDGTLLSVSRASGTRSVPILGINLGTLGFLTEVALDETFAALEALFEGNIRIEQRMRLRAEVWRQEELHSSYLALNDAVINQSDMARMLDISAHVNGEDVTCYHADGLIVATPTGSTAYSLSAGGPIVDPQLEALLLTPICPHTLTQRPVVLPADAVVEIQVSPRGGGARLTADGQEGCELKVDDRVRILRSEYPLALVVSPFRKRFEILREKLHWGQR